MYNSYLLNLHSYTSVAPRLEESTNPCQPSPCGPNSQCREINGQAVCSCLPNYIGSPPGCRPECVVSSECPLNKACINQKCLDPCISTCGINSRCHVVNHSPICTCQTSYTGDPFTRCYPIPRKIMPSILYLVNLKQETVNQLLREKFSIWYTMYKAKKVIYLYRF